MAETPPRSRPVLRLHSGHGRGRGKAEEQQLLLSFRVGRDRYAVAASWIREVLGSGMRIAVPLSALGGVGRSPTYHGRAYAVDRPGAPSSTVTGKRRACGVAGPTSASCSRDGGPRHPLLVDMVDAVGPKETIRGTNLETTMPVGRRVCVRCGETSFGLLAVDRLVADLDRLFE